MSHKLFKALAKKRKRKERTDKRGSILRMIQAGVAIKDLTDSFFHQTANPLSRAK